MVQANAELETDLVEGDEDARARRRLRSARQKAARHAREVRASRRIEADDDVEPADRIYTAEEIFILLTTELVVSPSIAGQALKVGRTKAYAACQRQEIFNFKIGRQYRVPTSWLRQKLGIPDPLPLLPATPKRREAAPRSRRSCPA